MHNNTPFIKRLAYGLLFLLNGCGELTSSGDEEKTIVFNRDIRPILNKNCTGCHGGVGKQSGVSFITREEALGRGHSGRLTVVPGNPDASGLIERVESKDPNIRMPYKAPPLKNEEIALLRQWIAEGAQWQEHWAFVEPQQPLLPELSDNSKINNEIDLFVQAKLNQQGLLAAEKADKATLLRRLSLDLIGLPPTLSELSAFVTDNSPDAYQKQVDRLLASKHFGERWASMWLDLARYADTKGYTWDKYRATWPYRDWVINAFNDNKSYQDFIIEQLAGDLLPNRSIDNMIATAFHRQTPANDEGGTDDEEFRIVAMLDRVSTTWSALNGITMNCVQCHSHPYDPINHDEFYKFYSFLNTTQDADRTNDTPFLKLAADENQREQAFQLQEQLIAIKQSVAKQGFDTYQNSKWQKINFADGEIDELSAVIIKRDKQEKEVEKLKGQPAWKIKVAEQKLTRLNEALTQLEHKANLSLSIKNGEIYETSEGLAASAIYKLRTQKVEQPQTISALRFMVSGLNPEIAPHTPEAGYNLNQIKLWLVKADGSESELSFATMVVGNSEVLAGQLPKLHTIHQARLQQNKQVTQPLLKNDNMGSAIALSAERLFNPRWSVAVLPEPILLNKGEYLRLDAYLINAKVRQLQLAATDENIWLALANEPSRIAKIKMYVNLSKALNGIKTIDMPVMYEQDAWDHRATALFGRGNFLAKEGELLQPDMPKLFPAFEQQPNRLAMAKWFFKPEQPLTARVAVNRFWHALFGRGIVKTLEDFGSIGDKPSHPELLDWLALTFQHELNWDIKALLRLLVSSHTYQQKANSTPELYQNDSDNKWLARGPKQRLTAEMVRDQALLASGLLSKKMGGIGVMPPQPDNIWGRKGVKIKDWQNATGEDRYRRAVYTFIKRQYTYPSFETFDMESRELSHARRIPTNTPLQALVTLNDPVYHEAAQALAKIMQVEEAQTSVDAAIHLGFQRVLSRPASSLELSTMKEAFNLALQEVGKGNDHDAWTALASILFNLDSALTR